MTEPTPQYLGTKEVARMLGVSPMTITRLIHGGSLPALRVGRRLQILRSDLDRYRRDNVVGGLSSPDPSPRDTPNLTNRDHR